jgi:putative ABC transport system permease protein
VNLELILQTLDDILGKVAFVIRFMAIFSIITGLLVLAGSVMISKYQRIQESVLLRTLGAVKWQVYKITAMEYFILGSLASLVGILLSLGSSWALAYFTFEAPFLPSIVPMIVMFMLITLLTMVIGLANSRSVVTRPPLEILRNDI